MKATWEKIDKNIVSIDVEVDADKVASALDQAFKKVSAKVNVHWVGESFGSQVKGADIDQRIVEGSGMG